MSPPLSQVLPVGKNCVHVSSYLEPDTMEGWKEGREGKRRKSGKKIDKKERREEGMEEGRKEFMRIEDQSGQWAVGSEGIRML